MRKEILKYERIRNLRIDKNLTQKQVAEIIGMSQTGYSKYEIGVAEYPIDVLIKLSELYNTSIDYLLGLTDEQARLKRVK